VRRLNRHHRLPHRRGSIVPLVAFALVAVLGALALVVDRLWIDAARVELRRAAESAALAGARALADDDRLKTTVTPEELAEAAAWSAVMMARTNRVAGRPLELSFEEDVAVGQYATSETTGETRFLTETADPRTVVVRPMLLRSRNNPVALLVTALHGPTVAELSFRVEASVDNRVYGVRPLLDTRVPVLPIAILRRETTNERRPNWQTDIVQRGGGDRAGYDLGTRLPTTEADGIHEIELRPQPGDMNGPDTSRGDKANVAIVNFGSNLSSEQVVDQIQNGLSTVHLDEVGGWLIPDITPVTTRARFRLSATELDALTKLQSQARLVLLYTELSSGQTSDGPRVRCDGLVAGRFLKTTTDPSGQPSRLIFQPSVVATRTALVADEAHPVVNPNPHLYHLSLTAPR